MDKELVDIDPMTVLVGEVVYMADPAGEPQLVTVLEFDKKAGVIRVEDEAGAVTALDPKFLRAIETVQEPVEPIEVSCFTVGALLVGVAVAIYTTITAIF